jgi:hypothetical protein
MIFDGTYQCDNNNLKLDCVNSSGERRKILAQVLLFTDNQMQIRYVMDEYDVTVTVIIRKISNSVN